VVADLLSENAIFFDQVFDHLLLALIHPTGNRNDENENGFRAACIGAAYHARSSIPRGRLQNRCGHESSFRTFRGQP
jgi:hypothetical protein